MKNTLKMKYLLYFIMVALATAMNPFDSKKGKCQPITIDTCKFSKSNGYTSTYFPNGSHRTQKEAKNYLKEFERLIKVKCHRDIKLLVCAQYVPLCIENFPGKTLKPCRSLCEQVRNGCEGIVKEFGFEWPFNCSQYPGEGEICVSGSRAISSTTVSTNITIPLNTTVTPTSSKKTDKGKSRRKRGKVTGKEGENVEMKCKKGYGLIIKKVTHKNSMCCSSISKQILSIMCHHKKTCRFTVNQNTFGGHCLGKVGSVIVRYKCEKTSKGKKQKDRCAL